MGADFSIEIKDVYYQKPSLRYIADKRVAGNFYDELLTKLYQNRRQVKLTDALLKEFNGPYSYAYQLICEFPHSVMSEANSRQLDDVYFNASRIMLSNVQMEFLDNIICKLNSGAQGLQSAQLALHAIWAACPVDRKLIP